ncbi:MULTISPECIES: metallophosphoesterase [unclassified Micromonospora]|uniref:metallophosphoesterase family protein n=1 Tax=unclassified Micromonospora TaxID=2617518 RepID=UPI003316E243
MRITGRGVEPVTEVTYQRARSGGGTETARLTVGRLGVEALPAGCDAVLVTGDLQGVAPSPWGGPPVLLGVALADYLPVWAEQGLIPPSERLAVVLVGDLYSTAHADRRGDSGEVADVWWALVAVGCRLVVGVAGNHDVIASDQLAELGPAAALLDGGWIDHGRVRFAGVGSIIGDPRRSGRRSEPTQLARIGAALAADPAVLVLHEGPQGEGNDQPGHPAISAHLRTQAPALTVCGHVHWETPLARLGAGHVLNVDGRAIVLTHQPD